MSRDSDIAVIGRAMDEQKRARRAKRLSEADPTGWTQPTPHHWSRTLLGDRLDYWPSTTRFMWRGRKMVGDVSGFIRRQEAASSPQNQEPNP